MNRPVIPGAFRESLLADAINPELLARYQEARYSPERRQEVAAWLGGELALIHLIWQVALAVLVAFTGGLASLARDADAAQEDAGRQAQWQAQALGEAQTRAKRQSERLAEALAAYGTARERRESDPTYAASTRPAAGLAQVVQSDAHSSKHRSARPSALPSGRRKRTAQ